MWHVCQPQLHRFTSSTRYCDHVIILKHCSTEPPVRVGLIHAVYMHDTWNIFAACMSPALTKVLYYSTSNAVTWSKYIHSRIKFIRVCCNYFWMKFLPTYMLFISQHINTWVNIMLYLKCGMGPGTRPLDTTCFRCKLPKGIVCKHHKLQYRNKYNECAFLPCMTNNHLWSK